LYYTGFSTGTFKNFLKMKGKKKERNPLCGSIWLFSKASSHSPLPAVTLLGMNLLFLSRGGIHFPSLESARTKNRPVTICVFNKRSERGAQSGEALPWLMG
jgi:hypothetical protein